MTTDEQISFSDNSHLLGVPFIIREKLEAVIHIRRKDLREWIKRVKDLPIEFHFVYK